MPSALPLLLLGGAAVVVLGGKKKRSGGGGRGDIPLDKPVQVNAQGLTVNSGRSPVPPAVKEAPLEPFDDIQQVQEGLIAAGKPLKHGADGKWGGESQGALDSYSAERGFVNEAKAHLATPDSLRTLHDDAVRGTDEGRLASPTTGIGTMLWCDITQLRCPPGHECVPIFAEGQAPPGYEDLGICIPVDMINAGYMPPMEKYAPGGFNEIVFSPDYEAVTIGGGWKLQTLDTWLYSRMRAGKLLTYAKEGSLFWEDLIVTTPGDFWNSTLASVGLAVPAGAAIGTQGWLSYRREFRNVIEFTPVEPRAKHIALWKGPEGYIPHAHQLGEAGQFDSAGKRTNLSATWPPPVDVLEDNAGFRGDRITTRAHAGPDVDGFLIQEPRSGPRFGKLGMPDVGGTFGSTSARIDNGHPRYRLVLEVAPDDPRIPSMPAKPGAKPYIVYEGDVPFSGEPHRTNLDGTVTRGNPKATIPSASQVHAARGRGGLSMSHEALDRLIPSSHAGVFFYADDATTALEMAKMGEMPHGGGRVFVTRSASQYAKSLASRMVMMWTQPATVTEYLHRGTRSVVRWARPTLKQLGKNVGIPLAVGAVIAGAVYGTTQLVRALSDKQRDLIAESAILAWQDFAKSHHVRVGSKKVRIDRLEESIAVQFFQSYVAKRIVRFQMSTYE